MPPAKAVKNIDDNNSKTGRVESTEPAEDGGIEFIWESDTIPIPLKKFSTVIANLMSRLANGL